MGWGTLLVWNDDTIAAKPGFPPHFHSDMEIVTYIRASAITHKDSLGNKGRTQAGDVQGHVRGHAAPLTRNTIERMKQHGSSRFGTYQTVSAMRRTGKQNRFRKALAQSDSCRSRRGRWRMTVPCPFAPMRAYWAPLDHRIRNRPITPSLSGACHRQGAGRSGRSRGAMEWR